MSRFRRARLKCLRSQGFSSVNEVEKAAKEDRLRQVKGVGAALQSKLLQRNRDQAPWGRAAPPASRCNADRICAGIAETCTQNGVTLDESGLHAGRKLVAAKTEENIYKALV